MNNMSGNWMSQWLLLLLAAASLATPQTPQQRCSIGKDLALNVEVKSCGCGTNDVQRRSLTISINEPSEGGLPVPSPVPRPAPPGYLTLPGLGHYRAPAKAKNWYNARIQCRQEGGDLVALTSRGEVELLFQHFAPNATGDVHNDAFWHSANDIKQEGKFVTEDGVPLEDTGFALFYPRHPFNSTSNNCILIRDDRSLIDYDCNQIYSFICKVPILISF